MVSVLHQINTHHDDLIHDARTNYYGTRLATCGSDKKIKIFALEGDQSRFITELSGHDEPVWQLDWSHPEFGNLLASCSYDCKVIIWKEKTPDQWEQIYEYKGHGSSVNSVQWAPREFGLMLACASSDQSISILQHSADNDGWEPRKIPRAHGIGVNAVSWAPPISSVSTIYRPRNASSGGAGGGGVPGSGDSGAVLHRPTLVKRIVSGGCDSLLKIWKYDDASDEWKEEAKLDGHTDWVRDVAWAPSIGLPRWYIASCSQDKSVIIWTNNEGPNGTEWESKSLTFNDIVWHVSWSAMGNILAVSCGENQVSLYKEDMNGEFRSISDVPTTGFDQEADMTRN